MTTFQFIAGMALYISALGVGAYLVIQGRREDRASRALDLEKVTKKVFHEKY